MSDLLMFANWKMNKTKSEAEEYIKSFNWEDLPTQVATVICPPFIMLETVRDALDLCEWESEVYLGAQNCATAKSGAYTGEVSAAMLRDYECAYVLLGHSERRHLFGESNETVATKAELAWAQNLMVVLCIGETEAQRDAGETARVLQQQLQAVLPQQPPHYHSLIIAYEPVWAIGTGRTAEPQQVAEVLQIIRSQLGEAYGVDKAQEYTLLYGGSVNSSNIEALAHCGIDGALVGGASLDPKAFAELARLFAAAKGVS